jgi:hypothetical protein
MNRARQIWSESGFPSSLRRGGRDINKTLEVAGGVVVHTETFIPIHHPVCAASDASRHLIHGAATPPQRGGERRPLQTTPATLCRQEIHKNLGEEI